MSEAPIDIPLPTRRATIHLAKRLAPHLAPGDLVVLSGPLGAGKTFFVRALCRALGLPESEPVTSPTFTLIAEIEARLSVAHADLYRIETAADLRRIGLSDLRKDGRLLLVEWGEKFASELGGDAVVVDFSLSPRVARLSATGARSREIVRALGAVVVRRSS